MTDDATGFDMALARQSYAGISLDPEKRAQQDRDSFLAHMREVRERLEPLAQTAVQRAILETELATYRANWLARNRAVLAAKGRTMSPMITGPANFPAARNQKRLDTERKRLEEMLDWEPRAQEAIRKKLFAARTPDQVDAASLRRLKREIDGNMATVWGIDHDNLPYTRSAFVNSVVGYLRRAVANRNAAIAAQALAYLDERQKGWRKPFLTRRASIWQEVADACAAQATPPPAAPTGTETITEVPGLAVIRNHDLDRVQLIFDGKPDELMRSHLKSTGWNWSPREGAWQRKLTANAEASAAGVVALWGAR